VVNLSFCVSKPNKNPTPTSTYAPKINVGCAFLFKRPSAGNSIINLDNTDLLDTTNTFFQESGFTRNDFARHHVIPWNRISRFFNLVFLHDKKVQKGLCTVMYSIMNYLMSLASRENVFEEIAIPTTRNNLLVRLIQTTSSERLNDMVERSHDPVEIMEDIHRFFTWFPGNIFIGPKSQLRGDDPLEEFEKNAKFVIGDVHFKILEDIDTQMKKYIKDYVELNQNDRYKIINKVVDLFKKLLPYSVTPFNPKNWQKDDKTKKWSIIHEYLNQYHTYSENKPVPDTLSTQASGSRRTGRELKKKAVCMYEDMYSSILSEVRKNCISSNASCGCQLSKNNRL